MMMIIIIFVVMKVFSFISFFMQGEEMIPWLSVSLCLSRDGRAKILWKIIHSPCKEHSKREMKNLLFHERVWKWKVHDKGSIIFSVFWRDHESLVSLFLFYSSCDISMIPSISLFKGEQVHVLFGGWRLIRRRTLLHLPHVILIFSLSCFVSVFRCSLDVRSLFSEVCALELFFRTLSCALIRFRTGRKKEGESSLLSASFESLIFFSIFLGPFRKSACSDENCLDEIWVFFSLLSHLLKKRSFLLMREDPSILRFRWKRRRKRVLPFLFNWGKGCLIFDEKSNRRRNSCLCCL
jgi:hypothetical protein